ncbi:restriction endonuclease subunit S [Prevotella sp.]|uniref:restriction endonuclease subunit S n=1 Tax=Prevotella sp. TaxID=59823 RepID=UPI003F822706
MMERYSEYKDSGVKWLGEIPSHWEVQRLGSFFSERKEKVSDQDYAPLSVTKQGIFPQLENVAKTNDGDNRKLVKEGDFVINSRSDRKGSSGVSELDGSVSLINLVLQPRKTIFGPFCNYLLKSYGFIEENYRNGRGIVADLWTTRYNEMKMIKVAMPSLEEQKTISSYLDTATSEIDKAIAMQQKMIDLLNERKQIIIQNAVTKGLDENVEMKESGVEWIGRIPKHWEVKPLRKYLKVCSKRNMPDAQLLSVTREEGVIVRNIESKEENHNYIPDDLSNYKYVQKGQFVINKMKSWQGSYGVSNYDGIVSPAYFVYDLMYYNKEYFSLAIRSKKFSPFFSKYSKGIRIDQWDLMPEALKIIPFLEPPVEEQNAIVHFLEDIIPRINDNITNCQRQITLLQERKQIIINEVVTGKVRVI